MNANNPLPSLVAALDAARTNVANLEADVTAAQERYAAPGLTLYNNNGAGYDIGVAPPAVPHDGVIALTHTPFGGGDEVPISTQGTDQLPIGTVQAQWVFPDQTSSEVATLNIG